MILQEDVDFLEHFGVMGMHWGVRDRTNRFVSGKEKHSSVTSREQKRAAKRPARRAKEVAVAKKVAIGVGVAATAYAGASIASHILKKKRNIRLSKLPKPPANFSGFGNREMKLAALSAIGIGR